MREMTSLLFSALSSDYGIKVTTSDPDALRQKLYKIRREDSTFQCLSFIISPVLPQSELWIIKREEQNGED